MATSNSGSSPLLSYNAAFSEEEINDILGAVTESQCNPKQNQEDQQKMQSALSPATESHPVHPSSDDISLEQRALARSERKRSREKQRRSDVNKQFADLTALLRKIETEDHSAGLGRLPLTSSGPTNRVDLIARTIAVLERIHDTNKKRKQDAVELMKQLEETKKIAEDTAARLKEATAYQQGPKPMMMMVPMWVSPDAMGGSQGRGAAGAAATATAPAVAAPAVVGPPGANPCPAGTGMSMAPFMPQMMMPTPFASAPHQQQQQPQQPPSIPMMPQQYTPMMLSQALPQQPMMPQQQQTAAAPSDSPPNGNGQTSSPTAQPQSPSEKRDNGGKLAHAA